METDRKILLTDREYPRRLLEIPQAPKQLYVRGKLPEEGVPSVAVIGARDCSYYGQEVAKRLGRLFGENGIQVISGMARGIGFSIGFTVLGALLLYVLQHIALANLPIIGKFLAELVRIVESNL